MTSRINRIDYASGGHGYALDGKKVPGVTTIINASSPAGGLLNWYGRHAAEWAAANADIRPQLGDKAFFETAAKAANAVRDAAAERGRAIHAAADALVDGQPVDVPEDIYGPARLITQFLDTWRAVVRARECVVFHGGHRYAGQFDLIADLADGRRWLLDYKTGSGVWPTVALQMAAYRNAEYLVWNGEDKRMPEIDATGVVHVTENAWHLIPVETGPDVFDAFVSSIPVYRFHGTTVGKKTVGEPLPDPEPLGTVTHIVPEVTR